MQFSRNRPDAMIIALILEAYHITKLRVLMSFMFLLKRQLDFSWLTEIDSL